MQSTNDGRSLDAEGVRPRASSCRPARSNGPSQPRADRALAPNNASPWRRWRMPKPPQIAGGDGSCPSPPAPAQVKSHPEESKAIGTHLRNVEYFNAWLATASGDCRAGEESSSGSACDITGLRRRALALPGAGLDRRDAGDHHASGLSLQANLSPSRATLIAMMIGTMPIPSQRAWATPTGTRDRRAVMRQADQPVHQRRGRGGGRFSLVPNRLRRR